MRNYSGHSALIIVPAALTDDANQLALYVGDQPGDDQTFGRIWYGTTGDDQTHSIAYMPSASDQLIAGLGSADLSSFANPFGADAAAAQRALDAIVAYPTVDGAKITAAIDTDPAVVYAALGLVRYQPELVL